jgi:hypothetical protein
MKEEILEDLFQEEIYNIHSKTFIVIPTTWSELSEDDIQLLSKILTAVKLNLSSVRIVTLSKLENSSQLPETPSSIILFGVPTHPSIKLYQPSKLMGIPIIVADRLPSLDEPKKKNLWVALKAMYTV